MKVLLSISDTVVARLMKLRNLFSLAAYKQGAIIKEKKVFPVTAKYIPGSFDNMFAFIAEPDNGRIIPLQVLCQDYR